MNAHSLLPELAAFFFSIRDDSRISPVHISLFMAIIQFWKDNDYKSPVSVFGHELMNLAKISGVATYHKSIQQLEEYGYIKYEPSFDRFVGSSIYIIQPRCSM